MKKIIRNFTGSLLAVAMILSGANLLVVTSQAAETEIKTDKAVYVQMDNMSDYWSATDGEAKAPVKEGHVFAGWYESEDKTNFTALTEAKIVSEDISATTTYAKFVDAKVLSVKTAVEAHIEKKSSEINEQDKTTFRILSAVDSLNYQSVGFEIYRGSQTTDAAEGVTITTVWSELKKNDTETITPEAIYGTNAADYFIALDIDDVAFKNFSKTVYVRPYWVTMDGTKVMGMAKNVRIEDKYTDHYYVSAPINLITDGASPAQVAAGKVTVNYDKDNYTVIKNSNGKYVDAGRALTELDYYVNEAEGTITIVANAETVNTDVLADGLFANIRFQRKTDLENGTLEGLKLQIQKSNTAVEFCNWAEQDQTAKVKVQ